MNIFESQPNLFKAVSSSSVFREVSSHIKNKIGFFLELNNPSAQSVFLGALFHFLNQSVFVVQQNERGAEGSYENLSDLLGGQAFLLPGCEEDALSVPGLVFSSRSVFSHSLSSLLSGATGLFVSSLSGVKTKIRPPKEIISGALTLRVGDAIQQSTIIEKLVLWGYESADPCLSPKTFAKRGGILDVFTGFSRYPLRFEFFGEKIDSIRIFNPDTQLSEGLRSKCVLFPPVLSGESGEIKLSDIIEDTCPTVLYITPEGFSFLSRDNIIKTETIELKPPNNSPPKSKKVIDTVLDNKKIVAFFYNPTKRPLYRQKEMFPLTFGPSGGFYSSALGVAYFSPPLGTKKYKQPPFSTPHINHNIASLKDLAWGDLLVHQDHGLGLYRGLVLIGEKNNQTENIKIEYAGGSSVFVPTDRFNRVHKYIGTGKSSPRLSHIGSSAWKKQKDITKKATTDVVEHLVSSYRARSRPREFQYVPGGYLMQQLETSFLFEETTDQLSALHDINKDFSENVPMDRLIYGDVGFGKTEIAVRAALRTVISGKAVFFLAPTTVLSDQHYITCKNRLGPLGVNVELLSRFRTKKQQLAIIENLHQNKIDVLVGTHRLLSEDVPTHNLGLLVIDEEHRFGVKQKETIRKIKNHIDILTLTATPIPRTLQQSLVGIRDTSKIETPPFNRRSIRTYVKYFDWPFLIRAIKNELHRGGQIYFLHNDINGLPFYYDKLKEALPNASIALGHGKMDSRLLEKTILSFFDGKIDVLLCTTIVESGLDVPNANTIIINGAHKFGLSQLYQIRGRVGRGDRRAHCYLCVPRGLQLPPDARERLKTIEYYSSLGSGYNISMKDLEIRGAGNLFGYEQSGQISKVGFVLYNKMLAESILDKRPSDSSRAGEKPSIVFTGPAHIDRDYMPRVQDRLSFYQKISEAQSAEQLDRVCKELLDRFGPMPPSTKNLIEISFIQCFFYYHPIRKFKISSSSASFYISGPAGDLDPKQFILALKKALKSFLLPHQISVGEKNEMKISFSAGSLDEALSFSQKFGKLFSRAFSL